MQKYNNINDLNLVRINYKIKNEYLIKNYQELDPVDFYRFIFPVGSFENKGEYIDGKYNGILTIIEKDKSYNRLIFDDLEIIKENLKKKFVVMSPVAFAGKRRTAKNGRLLYGFTIDLDGVNLQNLEDLFHQAKHNIILQPTLIANSGAGLHLYYIFKEPIKLYNHLHEKLRLFKYEVIYRVWNRYTSTLTERSDVQYQGIFQGFRMVGTQTKLGKNFLVKGFKTGDKIDILELNKYIRPEYSLKKSDFKYESQLSLEKAKNKYPEWYKKRIVNMQKKGSWRVKRDLYVWWKRRILKDITVGHRYNALCILCTYAIKAKISRKELNQDLEELRIVLDDMSNSESNRFTKRDVKDALHFYDESYIYFSRAEAERISGVQIPANKRNYRNQEQHLYLARRKKEDMKFLGEKITEGRPKGSGTKEEIVKKWREENPTKRKVDCIKELKLSKPTVYKYWK